MADALRHPGRAIQWPPGLQQLRQLPVGLSDRGAQRLSDHGLAGCHRRRHRAAPLQPGGTHRDRTPTARATGVVYVDRQTGLRYQQDADVVIVAANGVGTPRLLLLSESARCPNGLANSSDQVGRNLMHHGLAIIEIWTRDGPTPTRASSPPSSISEEFAETDPARGFVNGLTMHITRMNGAGYQANGSHSGNVAPWGPTHHAWFREHFAHGFNVLIVGDDLPIADNRVTLSEALRDDSGLPAPKITYKLDPNDRRMIDFGIELGQGSGASGRRLRCQGQRAY